jgi:trigger factor
MSYSVETVNDCTKKLVFQFESVDLSDQINAALKRKQSSVNLKGFRKGKAPLTMVQQVYGAQIENEALYGFLSKEFYAAIQKEGLKAIGYPTFGKTNYESENKKIEFEATVEIIPEIKLANFSKYEFKQDKAELSEEEYQNQINQYLSSKSEMIEVTDSSIAISKGHFAVMNFEGELANGEKPENMKGSEFLLEIGSGQFIPGFEDAMIGMKKNENKTIEVTFPEDYHEASLQSQPVKFHVSLLEIKEKKIPTLNDELAKEFGFESAENMQTEVRSRLEAQKHKQVKEKLHQAILEKFIADNTFDIPNVLLEDQKKALLNDLSQNLKSQGFNDQMLELYFDKWKDDVTQKAEFQVRSGLILDTLAKQFNIESNEADLEAKLQEMADESKMPVEQLKGFYLKNDNIKKNLMYAIREEKTFAKIIEAVKIS